MVLLAKPVVAGRTYRGIESPDFLQAAKLRDELAALKIMLKGKRE